MALPLIQRVSVSFIIIYKIPDMEASLLWPPSRQRVGYIYYYTYRKIRLRIAKKELTIFRLLEREKERKTEISHINFPHR